MSASPGIDQQRLLAPRLMRWSRCTPISWSYGDRYCQRPAAVGSVHKRHRRRELGAGIAMTSDHEGWALVESGVLERYRPTAVAALLYVPAVGRY